MSISSDAIYENLCKHIDILEADNNIQGLRAIWRSEEYNILTKTEKKNIIYHYLDDAIHKVEVRFVKGEVIPASPEDYPNTRGPYHYYLRWLAFGLIKRDPEQAYELALNVLDTVYKNPYIDDKHTFDELYFIPLIWYYERAHNVQTTHTEHFSGQYDPTNMRKLWHYPDQWE